MIDASTFFLSWGWFAGRRLPTSGLYNGVYNGLYTVGYISELKEEPSLEEWSGYKPYKANHRPLGWGG
jgi:hypothetical protein